jgi:hypothetical protein
MTSIFGQCLSLLGSTFSDQVHFLTLFSYFEEVKQSMLDTPLAKELDHRFFRKLSGRIIGILSGHIRE